MNRQKQRRLNAIAHGFWDATLNSTDNNMPDNTDILSKKATKAAEALQEKFSIGTFSQFCDEPADFDSAETEEIAEIIRQCFEPKD